MTTSPESSERSGEESVPGSPEASPVPESPGADTTWFVMPLFNEASVVGDVIRDLRKRYPLVVCVNDGSTDASAQVAREAGAVVVEHPYNMGQGAALKTGIDYVIRGWNRW
jgi:hypothetical protein